MYVHSVCSFISQGHYEDKTVYPLPIYERLSESGLGISQVNDFFIDTDDALNELVGKDIL